MGLGEMGRHCPAAKPLREIPPAELIDEAQGEGSPTAEVVVKISAKRTEFASMRHQHRGSDMVTVMFLATGMIEEGR